MDSVGATNFTLPAPPPVTNSCAQKYWKHAKRQVNEKKRAKTCQLRAPHRKAAEERSVRWIHPFSCLLHRMHFKCRNVWLSIYPNRPAVHQDFRRHRWSQNPRLHSIKAPPPCSSTDTDDGHGPCPIWPVPPQWRQVFRRGVHLHF